MKKKNSHLPEFLLGLVGVVLIGTALYHILPDYLDNRKSADTYQTLEEKFLKIQEADSDEVATDTIETAGETAKTDKTAAEKNGSTITTENVTEPTTEDSREEKKDWWFTDVTVAFDELKKENEEIIGWLRFDDAEDLHISYPVLYSGDDEKYLRSDIYGEEHIAGSIFLEGKNKPDFSDYYAVIYGHNMRDGSMFGDLDLYKETDFWKNILILRCIQRPKRTATRFSPARWRPCQETSSTSAISREKNTKTLSTSSWRIP